MTLIKCKHDDWHPMDDERYKQLVGQFVLVWNEVRDWPIVCKVNDRGVLVSEGGWDEGRSGVYWMLLNILIKEY